MMQIRKISASIAAIILVLTSARLHAGPPDQVQPPYPPGAINGAPPSKVLIWDADLKEVSPKINEPVAKFVFSVTNVSDNEIVITDAKPSCGCTEATMPSKPWHLGAHSNGVINVGVNLAGKSGTVFKWVDVFYGSNEQKRLNLKVNIPENPVMARNRNQDMAKADRQAVFKNDCAKCHAEPAKDKVTGKEVMGKELYASVCGVCHEASPRATMVPDLHAINHSTDLIFWKVWISQGKAGTMMPAFAKSEGGPLTDEQIDSLAQIMLKSFPPNLHAAMKFPGASPDSAQKN